MFCLPQTCLACFISVLFLCLFLTYLTTSLLKLFPKQRITTHETPKKKKKIHKTQKQHRKLHNEFICAVRNALNAVVWSILFVFGWFGLFTVLVVAACCQVQVRQGTDLIAGVLNALRAIWTYYLWWPTGTKTRLPRTR